MIPASPAISIRALDLNDSDALYAMVLAQGSDLDAFAWRSHIDSPEAERAFIAWASAAELRCEAFSRAILADGKLCGCASLYLPHSGTFDGEHPPSLQAGYWIDRAARGHGASWKAMRLLMDEASLALPCGSTVGIRARSRNGASLACAAKLGLLPIPGSPASLFDPADTDAILIGPLARCEPLCSAQGAPSDSKAKGPR